MVAIACVVLALVGLYVWLIGHWFGRVVAFLVFLVGLGLLGATLGAQATANIPGVVIGSMIGGVLAWFAAGIPTYCWHRVINRVEAGF